MFMKKILKIARIYELELFLSFLRIAVLIVIIISTGWYFWETDVIFSNSQPSYLGKTYCVRKFKTNGYRESDHKN